MIIALFTFWIILSSEWNAFFIIASAISIWLIISIDRKLFGNVALKIKWSWLVLLFQLLKDMITSSFSVMKIIWLNKKVESSVTWIENSKNGPLAQIAYANAITLTPGTMSMDLKDNKILVHSLKVKP